MPKERLQSILGSNISLNDENKEKLTNILEVPRSTVDENKPEVPSSTVRKGFIQRVITYFISRNRH